MATSISHSPAETEALGEALGREAGPGLVIGLSGDLGAGKTAFVRGLARGLGITARIQSPTFALINVHSQGRLPLFHLDLYRLDTAEQILAAGLEDYLSPAGVTVIEWAERWFGLEGQNFALPSSIRGLWVRIEALNETDRRITYGSDASPGA